MSTKQNGIDRRKFLKTAGAAATLSAAGFPAIAQQRTKLRVGYVNTLAVNGQIWTGVHRGHWAKENLELLKLAPSSNVYKSFSSINRINFSD